jgi:hypothetical protein
MLMITISTLYETILLALLMLIGLGWGLVRFSLSRNQATTITLFMGGIYLSYSGFYIADDLQIFKYIIMVRELTQGILADPLRSHLLENRDLNTDHQQLHQEIP